MHFEGLCFISQYYSRSLFNNKSSTTTKQHQKPRQQQQQKKIKENKELYFSQNYSAENY